MEFSRQEALRDHVFRDVSDADPCTAATIIARESLSVTCPSTQTQCPRLPHGA